jgi:hypothetical protein
MCVHVVYILKASVRIFPGYRKLKISRLASFDGIGPHLCSFRQVFVATVTLQQLCEQGKICG